MCLQLVMTTRLELDYPWASVESSGLTKFIEDSSQCRARESADGG